MATSSGSSWYTRPYEGGWRSTSTGADKNGWLDDFTIGAHDGYCYSTSDKSKGFCFCFKFTDISKLHKTTSLKITIPLIRGNSFASSGELYIKMFTSSRMENVAFGNDFKPSSTDCDAKAEWSCDNQNPFKVTFTIDASVLEEHNIKNDTYIYITVGGSKLIQIGYPGYTPAGGWWSATLNYETYTNAIANKPIIIDNKNSTFSITTPDGTAGTNNSVKSTSLYYRIGSSGEYTKHSSKSITNKALTCADSSKSQWVYAYSVVDGTHNDATSTTASLEIPNYAAPGKPGIPELTEASYKNGRLTVKQNWTFTWTAATRANDNSYVKGYRVRILKNGSAISGLVYSKQDTANIISNGTNANNYIDCENTNCIIKFDPVDLGFKPGDTVSVGIYAYTRDGAGTLLFNGGGQSEDQVVSVVSTIQNAGIVNVKVAGKWVEGQVWVKANNTWHEAETVNVKVNGAWRESQ